MRGRVVWSLAWAIVFYFVGCKVVGAVAGTVAAARNPDREKAVASAAGDEAIETGKPFLLAGAAALAVLGAWFGAWPGTGRAPQLAAPLCEDGLDERNRRFNRLLAGLAVGLLGSFVLAATALHLLRPEYDPLSRFLSEYVVGPYGDLMTAGLALSGASAVVLALALLRSATRSFWLVVGATSLALAGIGYIMCALFPTDLYAPGGGPYRIRTTDGVLHDNLATASALCATLAFVLLPVACRRCPRLRRFIRAAVAAGCAAAVALVIGGRLPREFAGLGQRLWVGTLTVCCLMLAFRLRAVAANESEEDEGQAAMS